MSLDEEQYLVRVIDKLNVASKRGDTEKVVGLLKNSSSAVCSQIDYLCKNIYRVNSLSSNPHLCETFLHIYNGEHFVEELSGEVYKFLKCSYFVLGKDLLKHDRGYLFEYPSVIEGIYNKFVLKTNNPFEVYSPSLALEQASFSGDVLETNFILYEKLRLLNEFFIKTEFDMDD